MLLLELVLLLMELRLLLLLLLHTAHGHWLELSHHRLETTTTSLVGGWSVERITVLLMCHAAATLGHQLAEGVIARQIALRLELILLSKASSWLLLLLHLLILVVEAI